MAEARFTLVMSETLKDAVEFVAKATNRTMTAVIVDAVETEVSKHRQTIRESTQRIIALMDYLEREESNAVKEVPVQ